MYQIEILLCYICREIQRQDGKYKRRRFGPADRGDSRKRSISETCPLYRSQRCTNAIEISYIHIWPTCIYFIKYVTALIFLGLSLPLHVCYCPVHTFATNRILNRMLNAWEKIGPALSGLTFMCQFQRLMENP